MKNLVVGIVAHVDAGKTTCIESMLYTSGKIRKQGRVDHGDTILDFDEQERSHGITIYAKNAEFTWKDRHIYVIDTPGHVDFSAEMERTLSVLDCAVVVINGQDGVQSHTETIWKCLEHYRVPTILFVNKMDITHQSREELMQDLWKHCSKNCIDFESDEREDALSMVSEDVMNAYLEEGTLDRGLLHQAFAHRLYFPVLFGSALKNVGIDRLLDTVCDSVMEKEYPQDFGAKVFRVWTDQEGTRLTDVKVTGGILHAKDKIGEEKADQLRVYTGTKYEMVQEAESGTIVSIKGLQNTVAGDGLGEEEDSIKPVLNAYLDYQLLLPAGSDILALADVCSQLAAQDPQLMIDVDSDHHAIHVRIMGEMQMEVLQKQIYEKSGISVGFGQGGIVYQESIAEPVLGVGHFEPLRHYAEVVVSLEPLARNSGIVVASAVPNGMLSSVWEKSILNYLSRPQFGVLTGSRLTDVKITLLFAKGNLKHTSGGDFRQAANRAVRQGLMKTENILLEPYETFTLEVPNESLSRALYDLELKQCDFRIAESLEDRTILEGKGPVRFLMNYQSDLVAYTKGKGKFAGSVDGYEPVKNVEEVLEEKHYDPESDLRHPTGSVFCANGAGYYVPWQDVEKHMHIDLKQEGSSGSYAHQTMHVSEDDLENILHSATSNNRNVKKQVKPKPKKKDDEREHVEIKPVSTKPRRMIVDGYNCLYSWECMKPYRNDELSIGRERLLDLLFAYQAYLDYPMVVVFDGYQRQDNIGSVSKRGEMEIVYTRTDITADAWIEKTVKDDKKKYDMTVVTSDGLIQNAVLAQGAKRMSSREFEQIVKTNQRGV